MEIIIMDRTSGGGGSKGGGTSSGGSKGGSSGGKPAAPKVPAPKGDSNSATGGGMPQPGVVVNTKKPVKTHVDNEVNWDVILIVSLIGVVSFVIIWWILKDFGK